MLYHMLVEENLRYPEIIIKTEKRAMTYQDIDREVRALTDRMRQYGVEKGNRVIIVNHNDAESAIQILACIYGGFIFVPIHEKTPLQQLEYYIKDSGASAVLDGGTFRYLGIVEKEAIGAGERRCGDFDERLGEPPDGRSNRQLVYIMYTSGSTSRPKGVTAAVRQIVFCLEAINLRIGNCEADRILCYLPLSFDYGLYQLLLALRFRACLYLTGRQMPQEILKILKNERITGFPVVPSIAGSLMETGLFGRVTLPCLRYICSTGEVFRVDTIRKLNRIFPDTRVIPMYGLTECKRVSIMPSDRQDKILEGSCGLPLDGVRVKLHDMDPDTGIGELYVYGPNVMEGYWRAPELTEEYFGVDRDTGERFLRTSDLFRIDDEGFLFFHGRKKRIVKCRGHRISCEEVEARALETGEVEEARAVPMMDSMGKEGIVLFIYPNKEGISMEVRDYIKECIPFVSIKKVVECKAHLPCGENGKVSDRILREWLNNG